MAKVYLGGSTPFECSEEEYDSLKETEKTLLETKQVSTIKQAANAAISLIKKQRKETRILEAEKNRQEVINAQVSKFQVLQITCTPDGFPEKTSANYEALLQNHPEFLPVRKDLFSGQIYYGNSPLNDTFMSVIYSKFSDLTKCVLENRQKIYDAVVITAEKNPFNQVRDYLDSLTWDKKKRIPLMFCDFLGTPQKKLYMTMATLWMIAAVKRIYEPGCKFDNIVIFTGPQGIGKSNFCEKLAVKPDWYCENVQIGDKDGYIQLRDSWIVNMDEIASLNKKDAATAKNFLTSRQDKFRSPYNKFNDIVDRHCIFVGTTNDDSFLKDSTAVTERRYWVVPCTGTRADSIVRYKKMTRDYVDQLWAEAVSYYKSNPNIDLYIPEDQWKEFVSDQVKYKVEDQSELFLFLDDALNREYPEFEDDSSLTNNYSDKNYSSSAIRKVQDKFTLNSINLLTRDNKMYTWRGYIKQYADMRADTWKYMSIRVSWFDGPVKGLVRIKNEKPEPDVTEKDLIGDFDDFEKMIDR